MLSKPVYECLPYLYLGCGFGLITYKTSLFTSIFGGAIFILGAIVWNMRSEYRRKDSVYARKKQDRLKVWYEFKPFILFLIGVFIVIWTEQQSAHIAAYLLSFNAIWILYMRANYRHLSRTLQTRHSR